MDLGCGNGRFLDYADVGVDFSKEMLKRAKRTGKDVILASILNLPFKEKSIDIYFSIVYDCHKDWKRDGPGDIPEADRQ